jgi:hypothetical protein
MVDVVLQLNLWIIDLPDDAQGLSRPMQARVWKIHFIQRLDQKSYARRGSGRTSPKKVFGGTF